MMRGARVRFGWSASLLALAVTTALTSCGAVVTGSPVSIYDDPFTVAGLPVTDGPSGPRPGVSHAQLDVDGAAGTDVDLLATDAVDDIQKFWRTTYSTLFRGSFQPVRSLVSWDATAAAGEGPLFCSEPTDGLANAGYCSLDDSIGWDRGLLMPAMIDAFGPMSVVMVLAHEYGHAVQTQSGLVGDDDPTIVAEQQADCFAGAFMRHVAEGDSTHFTLDTSDGLNDVLAATVAVRDVDPGDPDSVHGSAFERVTAAQIGFTDGAGACTRIDEKEVESRRSTLPQQFDSPLDTGELPVTQDSLEQFAATFEQVMPTADPPTVDYSGADTGCADALTTEPVSYCPSTNTIGISVDALADRGRPTEVSEDDIVPLDVTGDYGAYVLFVSRYVLAVQNEAGQGLTDARAALRSACLSGVVTAALSPSDTAAAQRSTVTLSPGDLDEAVSGLLSDGLAASDVDGRTVPSGFARVDAFRWGVLGGREACDGRYS
ncbi:MULTISPECIES: metallopeptidase [unclassified Rhodococcus (in: high G+C Gram-positive bacteria)]|uniref:metallopeptidase n=1 Tax=unclassified Rhodococcus (in: high G+C Gram-positive bacteria) TaxID=192944 RepID=UPI0027E19E63|nr:MULTISPECIES: metallopeptidase [unclassified Rhodococcus (in: high G+C Gram-positive bacteria)]